MYWHNLYILTSATSGSENQPATEYIDIEETKTPNLKRKGLSNVN
jgi:hypothetical protein